MHRTLTWRRILALPATLALMAGGVLAGATPTSAAEGDPFVTATPGSLTEAELVDTGVRLEGLTRDTPGTRARQDITVTTPSGTSTTLRDFTGDGTFDVIFKPASAEVGTYTVRSQGGVVATDAVANTSFEVTAEPPPPPDDPPASITVDPTTISPDDFIADGVQASGRTFDNGGPVNRSNLVLTSPSGATANYFDLTGDGTFNVNIKPKGDISTNPVETGTYTLTATSLLRPEFTATTTFVVEGEQAPPPASISVDPETISDADFVTDGVQASGRTFDTGSSVGIERSNLVLTSPSGATASYFDLTSDGTFNVNIKPKGDIATNPVETGTYTLTATSLLRPEFTATTTFEVTGEVVPPVDRDPEVVADPEVITQSDFDELGVNLSGFTEDTPGPLTRQDIFVTDPSGDSTRCSDFTGDGTFDVQVYPDEAPETGPEGQRTCSLVDGPQEAPQMPGVIPMDFTPALAGDGSVEVGTYDVVSYGFIREDARATTSFEVVADGDGDGGGNGGDDGNDDDDSDDDSDDDGDGDGDGGGGGNGGDDDRNGVLPDTGAGSSLSLSLGLAMLMAGGALVLWGRPRRTAGAHRACLG